MSFGDILSLHLIPFPPESGEPTCCGFNQVALAIIHCAEFTGYQARLVGKHSTVCANTFVSKEQ